MISRLVLLDTRNFYEVHKVLNTVKITSRASEQGHPKNFAQKKELKKKDYSCKMELYNSELCALERRW